MSMTNIRRSLGASWAQPGTRLGFWVHFSTQFSATTLGLLWGYPFFVRGEHRSRSHPAGLLLTLMVVAVMTAGPVARLDDHPPPLAPVDVGTQHRVVDRGDLDDRADLARRLRRSGSWSC